MPATPLRRPRTQARRRPRLHALWLWAVMAFAPLAALPARAADLAGAGVLRGQLVGDTPVTYTLALAAGQRILLAATETGTLGNTLQI